MPLYAYHCNDCGNEFELLVRSSDVPACPSCQSTNLQQLVSKICVEIKYPAIAASWRKQAQKEGDLSHFSKKEIDTKSKA